LYYVVVHVVARLVRREGFHDVSFRFGRRMLPSMGAAVLFANLVGAVAYGIAWLTGAARFEAPTSGPGAMPTGGSAWAYFAVTLLVGNTALTLIGVLTAAGEEIGWRGYMLTRLIDAGVPRPVLASGLIWSLWHVPLVIGGIYAVGANVALSAALFMVCATAVAFVLARLRLATGSVWPAILVHASWNAVILSVFDRFSAGSSATLWTGESGILVAAVTVALAFWYTRGPWPKDHPSARVPHLVDAGRPVGVGHTPSRRA
jgi:membrane protease YdiL (CAAX protease family)